MGKRLRRVVWITSVASRYYCYNFCTLFGGSCAWGFKYMARMELSCRRFALFGGAHVDAGSYSVCVHPGAPGLQKRGTLALITEPAGSLAQGEDACRLVQRAVVDGYFSDHSLGLTGSLLNALDTANNAVLQHN